MAREIAEDREIADDRETQERVMRALGVPSNSVQEATAKVAERAGLLKRNGRLERRSPSTTLDEPEAVTMAQRCKLAGWTALCAALGDDHVGGIDLGEPIARSEEHLVTLGEIHDRRAPDVLTFDDARQRSVVRWLVEGRRGRRGEGA
ncbi:MAG: hypothetical protein QM733_11805 [Ilumatobacteraceae bacterium]